MTSYSIAAALALLVALVTLRRDAPGRARTLRVVASVVVVAVLWFLAPRVPLRGEPTAAAPTPPDSIHWTQRVVVGDPVEVHGSLGASTSTSTSIKLIGPDGAVDSVTAQHTFVLRSPTRAVGHWIWRMVRGNDTLQFGVDVRAQPALRLLLLEGRPGFETAALARRLTGQGASITTVTRLTASERRVTRSGAQPPDPTLSPANLGSLDALIIGPGGGTVPTSGERSAVLAAVGRGLGLLHLVDTTQPRSAWFPFGTTTAAVAPMKLRPRLDGVASSTPIAVAPIALTSGATLLEAEGGAALARSVRLGTGTIIGMRLPATVEWTLAGEDTLAAKLWSAVLGEVLRPTRAEWRIGDSAHVRVDERVVVERIGAAGATAVLREGTRTDSVLLRATPGDSLRKQVALWPTQPGWLSLSMDGDTLWLFASPARHPDPPRLPGKGGESTLEWVGWLVVLAGIATLWRRR